MMRAMLTALAAAWFAAACSAQGPAPSGPEHELLKNCEGTWDSMSKGAAGEIKGVMTFKMALGGRWLQSDYEAEIAGAKFTGRGMDAYDAGRKKHVSVWMYSDNPRPLTFEGSYDAEAKKLTLVAELPAGPGGKPAKFKSVTHYPSADRMDYALFLVGPNGKDLAVTNVKYTRRK